MEAIEEVVRDPGVKQTFCEQRRSGADRDRCQPPDTLTVGGLTPSPDHPRDRHDGGDREDLGRYRQTKRHAAPQGEHPARPPSVRSRERGAQQHRQCGEEAGDRIGVRRRRQHVVIREHGHDGGCAEPFPPSPHEATQHRDQRHAQDGQHGLRQCDGGRTCAEQCDRQRRRRGDRHARIVVVQSLNRFTRHDVVGRGVIGYVVRADPPRRVGDPCGDRHDHQDREPCEDPTRRSRGRTRCGARGAGCKGCRGLVRHSRGLTLCPGASWLHHANPARGPPANSDNSSDNARQT